ncbi:MAG: type 1 glutamine amidotransferase [Planctomycetota bacterium]
MATILVCQHERIETPGRLGITLRDHGFKLDIRHLDKPASEGGDTLPANMDDHAGIISMGGLANVGDMTEWMQPELNLIRQAHERELPTIGICLGAQMIARALGGEVGQMPGGPEAGFLPISVQHTGQTHPLLAGIRWNHHQFHTHYQEVTTLPDGAQLLASSAACKNQMFVAGIRTIGVQFHFECDRPMIDAFYNQQPQPFEAAGISSDDLAKQCDDHYATYARLSDRLCVNLASFAFTFEELLGA